MISDLLKPERTNLVIREDKKKGVFVEGLSEWVVRSPQEIYGLMERGGLMRATGSTKMNELSSRSHAVFIIIAEQSETTSRNIYVIFSVAKYLHLEMKIYTLRPDIFTLNVNITLSGAVQRRLLVGGDTAGEPLGDEHRKGG